MALLSLNSLELLFQLYGSWRFILVLSFGQVIIIRKIAWSWLYDWMFSCCGEYICCTLVLWFNNSRIYGEGLAPVKSIKAPPPMAWATVNSKVMVLLLLIYCLVYFQLFVGVLRLSLFCYVLYCVHSSFAIILKRQWKLVALLLLSHRCIVTINVLWLFLKAPWLRLQCAIVVFAFHTHLLFDTCVKSSCTVYVYRDRISLVPFRFRLDRPSARSHLYSL